MKIPSFAFCGLIVSAPISLHAGCCEPADSAAVFRMASAIGDYRVTSSTAFRDGEGHIRTRHVLTLNESLKSGAPLTLDFSTPGGRIGNARETSSLELRLVPGEDYILHLARNPDGSWEPLPFRTRPNAGKASDKRALRSFIRRGARGKAPGPRQGQGVSVGDNSGVPSSKVTPTGYFEDGAGVPYRHITCDSGAPIQCLVDLDPTKLPAGTDATQALAIVQSALDAWSGPSSLKFKIEGTTSFGTSAKNIITTDGKIRIQLHDNYNSIASTSTLGTGGSRISGPSYIADPGSGATVAGQPFLLLPQGYVILNHRSSSMSDPLVFAEVLTHELGHALGLAHSSNDSSEPDAILEDATMYYANHNDGRGADIRLYDEDRVLFGYPLDTPPYSIHRVLRAVIPSSGNPKALEADPKGPGVDRITVTAGDLQGGPLTINKLSGNEFTLVGNSLIYTCPSNYPEFFTLNAEDIANGDFWHQAFFTISDGVNESSFYTFNVTGFHIDSTPSDGLPNTWLQTYFGDTTAGPVGSARHPDSDPDGDGLDNRTERYLGTNPVDGSSGPAKPTIDLATGTLNYTPVRFAPYVIESTTDLSTWTRRTATTTFATPAPASVSIEDDLAEPSIFYRVQPTP